MFLDFTLEIYRSLLEALLKNDYIFVRFDEFIKSETSDVKSEMAKVKRERQEASGIRKPFESPDRSGQAAQGDETLSATSIPLCVLRHDVDLLPDYALRLAKIENELGIRGSYYFRIVPESYDERIIKQIAELGHEIGYHYEDMDLAYRQLKIKNSKLKIDPSMAMPLSMTIDQAYELFKVNLARMREVADIKTICMHGSPLSPYDNKLIWEKYSYKELGIIGEPYLDIDWNEFGYLTDTGRRWDGVAVRDKVKSKKIKDKSFVQDKRVKEKEKSFIQDKRLKACPESIEGEKEKSIEQWNKFKDQLKSTQDVINALDQNKLPDKMMFTVHPQRWTDAPLPWVKELVMQNLKNVVKRLLIKSRA